MKDEVVGKELDVLIDVSPGLSLVVAFLMGLSPTASPVEWIAVVAQLTYVSFASICSAWRSASRPRA